jgi:hypothetical protein
MYRGNILLSSSISIDSSLFGDGLSVCDDKVFSLFETD